MLYLLSNVNLVRDIHARLQPNVVLRRYAAWISPIELAPPPPPPAGTAAADTSNAAGDPGEPSPSIARTTAHEEWLLANLDEIARRLGAHVTVAACRFAVRLLEMTHPATTIDAAAATQDANGGGSGGISVTSPGGVVVAVTAGAGAMTSGADGSFIFVSDAVVQRARTSPLWQRVAADAAAAAEATAAVAADIARLALETQESEAKAARVAEELAFVTQLLRRPPVPITIPSRLSSVGGGRGGGGGGMYGSAVRSATPTAMRPAGFAPAPSLLSAGPHAALTDRTRTPTIRSATPHALPPSGMGSRHASGYMSDGPSSASGVRGPRPGRPHGSGQVFSHQQQHPQSQLPASARGVGATAQSAALQHVRIMEERAAALRDRRLALSRQQFGLKQAARTLITRRYPAAYAAHQEHQRRLATLAILEFEDATIAATGTPTMDPATKPTHDDGGRSDGLTPAAGFALLKAVLYGLRCEGGSVKAATLCHHALGASYGIADLQNVHDLLQAFSDVFVPTFLL
jgi:hypothetical protein